MSPPRWHFGSSDNGMPVFGSTSFSIAPVHRHSIFKPRGAATGPLLALWERCRWPAVILVTASSRWMFYTVWLHFILHTITSILVLWLIAQLETHNVKWFFVLQPTFALIPVANSMCLACQKLSLLPLQIMWQRFISVHLQSCYNCIDCNSALSFLLHQILVVQLRDI